MKTIKMMSLAAIGMAALCVTPAQAGVSFQVSIGLPVWLPAPVVVEPPPCPPPVVVLQPGPAPVVVVEPPVCRPVIWLPPGHSKPLYRHDRHGGPGFRAAGWHGRR